MTQGLVLTPGGWRHPSLVHQVEEGQALRVEEGRVQLLDVASETPLDVPLGAVQPGDIPEFGSGWITYAEWMNNTGIPITSYFLVFKVPPAPKTSSGQTIFLFPGLDPRNTSDAILQPVLQWGPSAAGGGPYWAVATWYVLGSGQSFFTPLVPVDLDRPLVGSIDLVAQSGGTFSYTAEFQGIAGTKLPVQNIAELVWCNATLEAYGITACTDYPDADLTAMVDVFIYTGDTLPAMSWTPVDNFTDCGQHTQIVNNSPQEGQINLYYRNPGSNS